MFIASNGEVEITSQTIIKMAINIYAEGVEGTSKKCVPMATFPVAHLYEEYDGGPYPSHYLVSEAFKTHEGVKIPAVTLRERSVS